MRILIYGANYTPELVGIGKYSGETAEWLSQKGHEVRVVTAPPYYPRWKVSNQYSSLLYRYEFLNGVGVWRCPLWVPSKPSGLKRILHLGSFALSSFPIMLFHVFWRPNIVLGVEPPLFCAPTTLFVSRLCRARSWLHVQDFEVDAVFDLGLLSSPRLHRLVLKAESWLMSKFDRVSTVSGQMKKRLGTKGVLSERRVLFPNWVDTNLIHPLKESAYRNELSIGKDTIVALYSGNMGEKQGLEIIIQAARLLSSENNIQFVLCGDGAAREQLTDLATGLENVMWLPLQPLERLNDLLNLADIHLLPQRASAADLVMPSKLTGMLASGRPVLATANPGTEVADVLRDLGVIVPPEDEESFTESLRSLAKNKGRREELGKASRSYAEEHLHKDKILGQFEACLRDFVEGGLDTKNMQN